MALDITTFLKGEKTFQQLGGIVGGAWNVLDWAANNGTNAQNYAVLNIPAGAMVLKTFIYTVTAEAAADTVDLGDDTDPNGWDDNVAVNTTATMTCSLEATDPYGIGKIYLVADTIDILCNAALTAAKFMVVAIWLMVDPKTVDAID